MSSITTFRGRRCTKVRRNSTIPASSSIATSLTSTTASSLSASAHTESSTLSEAAATDSSTLAPTTSATSMATSQPSGPDETSTTATTSVDPTGLTPSTSMNPVTLGTSSTTTSLIVPALTSSQAPAPVASPDTPITSPQTPPPDPNSPSPDPSSGDQPGADPAPSAQSSKPNAQTTLSVGPMAPSTAASVNPQRSQQSTDSLDPTASASFFPIATLSTAISSGAVTSSIVSPLAISAASSGSSLISIPGSNPSGTIGNPNAPGQTDAPSGGPNRDNNGPSSAAVTGAAVGGVFGGLFLLAIIFFLFRKCRRGGLRFGRQSVETPLLDRNGGPRSSSELVGKLGRFATMLNVKTFMRRGPPTPNPIFSNMVSRSNSSTSTSPRRRSWSAPAPALQTAIRKPAQSAKQQSPTLSQVPPQLPPLFSRTNGSVSSITHAVYSPEPDSENNPFRDPEGPLRIVNPDPSRHGTPSGTPAPANKVLSSPGLQSKPPLPMQLVSLHSTQPQAQNPFIDPPNEVSQSNPSSSKITGVSPPRRPASVSSAYSKQSSIGPLPQITVLEPQQQSHVSQPSADSGFVSAGASPISSQERFEFPARNQFTTLHPSPATVYPSTTRSSWTFDTNNFGEPGPTRPNTSVFGGTSRISDPFDLDRPEVLGFMSPAVGKQSTVGRSNSNRSVKRESASVSDWPITGTIRPVQE